MKFSKNEKWFIVIFLIILGIDLICATFFDLPHLRYISKPSILIFLIVFFLISSNHLVSFTWITTLLALIFSLFGDILLMFTEVSANYFIYGLASFLLAHIMYILVFSKKRSRKPSVYFIIILLIYVLALLSLIFKGLGEMMVPVFLYIAAIMTMVVYASMREKEKSISSYNLVFLGAICFMVSDSLIALNKFHAPLPLSNLSIMFTYGIAQLLIVLGILKQN